MSDKEQIIKISKLNGVDIIGFTNLEKYPDFLNKEASLKEMGYLTPFHKEYSFDEFKEYKSIIVIGVSYYNSFINELEKMEDSIVHFSMSSWGNDYHKVLKEKLEPIKDYLENKNYKTKICIDNNSLNERYYALKAGLGYQGINGNIINDTIGSFFFIGCLLTDALFEYDKEINESCLKCMRCVKSCPTKCISENGIINGNKCLSYITQKKEITEEEKKYINNCIYGCDICNLVCPHNKNLKDSNSFPLLGVEFIDVYKYKPLSNKQFLNKYGSLSGSWRGKKIIERNLSIYKEKLEKKNTK